MRSLSHSHHIIETPCYDVCIEGPTRNAVDNDIGDTITSYYEQAEDCEEEQGAVRRHDLS